MRRLPILISSLLFGGCGAPPPPARTDLPAPPHTAADSSQWASSAVEALDRESQVLRSVARYVGEQLTAQRRAFDPRELSTLSPDSSLVHALARSLGAAVRTLDEVEVCGEWICRLESVDVVLVIHGPVVGGDTARVTVTTYSNSATLRPGLAGQTMRAERDDVLTLARTERGWQVVSSQLSRLGH